MTNGLYCGSFQTAEASKRKSNMAARRQTNNSSVASLEDQNAVINQVLEAAGQSQEVPRPLGNVIPKSGNKKKGKEKKDGTSKKPRGVVGDVTGLAEPSGAVQLGDAGPAVTQRAVPSNRAGNGGNEAVPSGNVLGNGGNAQLNGVAPPTAQPSGAGDAQGVGVLPMAGAFDHYLAQQQQQWLWMQQFNANPMNFGNFVPGARFGEDVQHFWDEEEQEGANEVEVQVVPEPPVRADRQGAHEMSEDEDDVPQIQIIEQESNKVGTAGTGKFGEVFKEKLTEVKEGDKLAPETCEEVADLLTKYLKESKASADMEKLVKAYPRPSNVDFLKVPRLDEELFQAVDQKVRNLDQSLQAIQKGVIAAMAAFAPTMDLAFSRGETDPEIGEMARQILEGFQLLAFTHNAMSAKRRDLIKPVLSPVYAKLTTKGTEISPDWLYGGDLAESTKLCETAKRITDKIAKRKPLITRGGGQQKRFRGPHPGAMQPMFPMLRGFNPFGMPRFPTPQAFGQGGQFSQFGQQQQPQQFGQQNWMGFQRRYRFPRGQRGQQGKRGAYHKSN